MPSIVVGDAALAELAARARAELTHNILPFWESNAFDDDGWLRGAILDDLTLDDSRPRHSVIAARILWTFAAATRDLPQDSERFEVTARKALDLLLGGFWDDVHGGVFEKIDSFRNGVLNGLDACLATL